MFIKKKEDLIYKFNQLQTKPSKTKNQQITTKYVKLSIINLTDIALTFHQTSLLNLAQKFVPTQREYLLWKLLQQQNQWH